MSRTGKGLSPVGLSPVGLSPVGFAEAQRKQGPGCHAVGGSLRTSHESQAVAWFDIEELPDTLFPWYFGPLRDAALDAAAVERCERQGLATVLAALRIDLQMRIGRVPDDSIG